MSGEYANDTTFADPIAWEATLPIRPSSPAWCATIKALYGSQLTADERTLFLELSGGREPPPGGSDELLVVAGRRAGKSESIARVGVFESVFGGHGIALAPGQQGLVVVISPLREQSQEIMNFARGLCGLPAVRRHLAGDPTRDEIRFKNGISLRVMTADAVAVSGPTVLCAIRDEWAKFPGDDAIVPDREIEHSLRPALAPVAGAPRRRLIAITSAYVSEGVAYETDVHNFGKPESPVLVVRGSTQQFNPAIDDAWLARERRRVGETVYRREYLAEWQSSIVDGYFSDVLAQCIDKGRVSSAPRQDVQYVLALDPAFSHDNFALCIAHRERSQGEAPLTVVDFVHVWKPTKGAPLSATSVIRHVALIARDYGVHTIHTDQHHFASLAEDIRRHGLDPKLVSWVGGTSETSKASKYAQVHAAMSSSLVRLPDNADLQREFSNVSAKLLRSGAAQFGARSGRDDLVSAAALAITEAMRLFPVGGGLPVNRNTTSTPVRPRRNLATGVGDGSPFGSSSHSAEDAAWDHARRHHSTTHETAPPAALGVLSQPGIFPRG